MLKTGITKCLLTLFSSNSKFVCSKLRNSSDRYGSWDIIIAVMENKSELEAFFFSFFNHIKATYDEIYVSILPNGQWYILCNTPVIGFHFDANIVTLDGLKRT